MLASANHYLYRFRDAHSNVFGDPRIENVSSADPEGHTANRARMRSMRIRTNDQLSRQRITFQNHRMADTLRTLSIFKLSVQPNAPLTCKILLLQLELGGKIKKPHLALLLGKHIIEKR